MGKLVWIMVLFLFFFLDARFAQFFSGWIQFQFELDLCHDMLRFQGIKMPTFYNFSNNMALSSLQKIDHHHGIIGLRHSEKMFF